MNIIAHFDRYRAKNRKAIVRCSVGVGKGSDLVLKEGQPTDFHAEKVYGPADDLLYSTSSATITPTPYETSVLREGKPWIQTSVNFPPT